MNKKLIAVFALAAGIAAYIYNKRKNKIDDAAEDIYDITSNAAHKIGKKAENAFS